MTPQQMEQHLRQTLDDGRLSAGGRQAMRQVLEAQPLDDQKVAAFRNRAFKLARDSIGDPQAGQVLDWLEDVVKLLHPIRRGGPAVRAEALFSPRDNLTARVISLFDRTARTAD